VSSTTDSSVSASSTRSVSSGARSRSGNLGSGAAIGLFMGVMCAFPLLAIGLATS